MKKALLPALILLGVSAISMRAALPVILLDFGPTTVDSTQATNAPYNTGLLSTSSWNKVGTADITSGVFFSDGIAASGVTIDLGASGNGFTTGTSSVAFGTQPSSTNAGAGTATILAGTSTGKDFTFTGTSGQNTAVGVSIGGLSAGTYTIYMVGFNSANGGANATQFWVNTSIGTPTSVSYASLSTDSTATASNSNFNGGWVANNTYVSIASATIAAGENLNLFSHGTTAGELRGFFNLAEIVQTSAAIPEPSTCAALAGVLALGVCLVRRRVSR